jgi:hypothetical protein
MSNIQTLDQKITVIEKQGLFELHFEVTGHQRVPLIVELAFRTGGELTGSFQERTAGDGAKVWLLKEGAGRYRVGEDIIEFGPGLSEHQNLNISGGPSYDAHGAIMKVVGTRVYITGFTPFQKVITIKGA